MERFYLPTEVVTGAGCLSELGRVAARFGQQAMLVCGQRFARASGLLTRAVQVLEAEGGSVTVFDAVAGEAELPVVAEGIALARRHGCQVYVGLGGGSAIDTAKAIAGMVNLPGSTSPATPGSTATSSTSSKVPPAGIER